MNAIEWTGRARKQFRQIDDVQRALILTAVSTLSSWPDTRNVKALSGREGYRLRAGRYRVIFTVREGKPRVIRVEEVKKRDERTY